MLLCHIRSVFSYFLTYYKMVTFWTFADKSGTTLKHQLFGFMI